MYQSDDHERKPRSGDSQENPADGHVARQDAAHGPGARRPHLDALEVARGLPPQERPAPGVPLLSWILLNYGLVPTWDYLDTLKTGEAE